ncbi:uncharacterized protein LOC125074524 [Vanessa atalanta]|uniref:uncharacterized protein LOC125074524 n=1 Tax=Vanessa atalanta TaxID=42275 RepID=UPI001FCCF3A4|nr:uncharacterized protein LOC125074524 [Vanessa atalanta]
MSAAHATRVLPMQLPAPNDPSVVTDGEQNTAVDRARPEQLPSPFPKPGGCVKYQRPSVQVLSLLIRVFECLYLINLSQCSRDAKRMRIIRSQESEQDHAARLIASQERQARLRASETSRQRELRLRSERSRLMAFRNRESSEQRNARLAADREVHALSRESENLIDRESRLSSQRVLSARIHSQETDEQREARLTADKDAHALSRESETFTDRESRLSYLRALSARIRSHETDEQRAAR